MILIVLSRLLSCLSLTWKELDSSPCNQKNEEHHSKFIIRETSFFSESADDLPDENSFVQHDSKRRISSQSSICLETLCKAEDGMDSRSRIDSQSSIHYETLHKADEGTSHSQNVTQCSNQLLDDPLCSVVPCSIPSQLTNSKPQNQDIDFDVNVSIIPEFEVDNCQKTREHDVVSEKRNEQKMSSSGGEENPATITNIVQETPKTLTSVAQTCRKRFKSLKTYSMIIPNQSLIQKCNQALLPTNQGMGVAALSDKKSLKGLFASKFADGSKIMQNHELFRNHKSNIEMRYEKKTDDLKEADKSSTPVEKSEERASIPILNERIQHSLLAPEIVGNDINGGKDPKNHVLSKSFAQHQQNNLNKLQAECHEFHDGHVRVIKHVRFSEEVERLHLKRTLSKMEFSHRKGKLIFV